MRLRIVISGETHDVPVPFAAQVAFERHFNLPVSIMSTETRAEHVAFLAYQAARRAKLTTLGFDEFVDTLDDLEVAPDPTGAASGPPTA